MSNPSTWADIVKLAAESMAQVAEQPPTADAEKEVVRLINVVENAMYQLYGTVGQLASAPTAWSAIGRQLNASYRTWYARFRATERGRGLDQLRLDHVAGAARAVALGTADPLP